MVALAFSVLMLGAGTPSLMIPIGSLLSVGVLLGYYAVTGRWDAWYLWLLLPFGIFAALGLTGFASRRSRPGVWARLFALPLGFISLVMMLAIPVFAVLFNR
jgi:hypothetical protein